MIFNTHISTNDILVHGAIKNLSKLSASLAASVDKEKVKDFCSAIDEHLNKSEGTKSEIQKLIDKSATIEPIDLEGLNAKKEFQAIVNLLNYMHNLSTDRPKGKKKEKQGSNKSRQILDKVEELSKKLDEEDDEEGDEDKQTFDNRVITDSNTNNKFKKKR